MTKTELRELIELGENSGVELKRDGLRPERLAQEMAALLNLEGGHILLGVEDDRTVSGLTKAPEEAEEWLMNVARDHVRPAMIPYWEAIEVEAGKTVGVVTLPADGPDKPYKAKRGSGWITVVRVGTTTRDATDAEEERLYQQSGRLRYDIKPVPGTTRERDLDQRRLENYFQDIREQDYPEADDQDAWERLLLNTDLAVESGGRVIPTVGAILMFGRTPNRYLPHAGITAVCYPSTEKDYEAKERTVIRGPVVALRSQRGVVETGVIERTIEFVRRNTRAEAWLEDGVRRRQRWDYPDEAVREAVVNAIAHRDYTITVTDIELSIYSDRLEVISPGRLPNTVTVDKMRAGYRASRNELVKEVLRDYAYIEATGLGVPRKIVRGMQEHNGTEPDLLEEEDRVIVRLWK